MNKKLNPKKKWLFFQDPKKIKAEQVTHLNGGNLWLPVVCEVII